MEKEEHDGSIVAETQPPQPRRRLTVGRRLLRVTVAFALTYLLATYVILPLAWKRVTRHQLDPSGVTRITYTAAGIHGDPVNVALLGAESDVIQAMAAAKWFPADPITFRSYRLSENARTNVGLLSSGLST
jgi:hypothetical protein